MSASFDRYWNNELAYPMQSLVSAKETSKSCASHRLRPPADPSAHPADIPTAVVSAEPTPMDLRKIALAWAPALLMEDKPGKIGPGDDEVDAGDTVVDGLLQLMDRARQDVLVISPYFVPGAAMMEQFGRMRARGVRIRVLTNSLASNDAPAAHAGYARYRKDLVALGIELL